jgi:L-alanine-DL-glutamate epimerase-like enolase superfamily enzyme
VNRILGGNLRKKVAIADNIGFMPIVDCLRRIDGDIKNGVRTIKLRIAANDNACIDLLREIRNQFGWELIIRLDAAGAWDDVGEAARILSRVEPYDIQYVQDALDRTDGESFRRLRDITGIPVAIGRAFGGGQITAREARTKLMNFIRADAIDVLAVSPAEAGGLYGFTKLAAMCDGASVNVVAGNARGSLSQAIWATGCIICRSTAYAHDIIPTGMPGGVLKDVSTKQITFDNGYIWPFNGQGFGVEPDWELLQSYCIATEQAGGID